MNSLSAISQQGWYPEVPLKSKTLAKIVLSVPLAILFASLGWAAFACLALPFALCAVSILSIVALVLFATTWS